jgi:hypothetical protein
VPYKITVKPRPFFTAELLMDLTAELYQEASRSHLIFKIFPNIRRGAAGKGPYTFLTTAFFVLGETVPAIHWTIFPGLERDFAFLFAVCTHGLMHLSWTSVVASILKTHIISP